MSCGLDRLVVGGYSFLVTIDTVFASIEVRNNHHHETEEERKETADYGGGLYVGEPQGGAARGDCRAREAGFAAEDVAQV